MKFNTKMITDIKEILVEEVRQRLEEGEEVAFNELEQDTRTLAHSLNKWVFPNPAGADTRVSL